MFKRSSALNPRDLDKLATEIENDQKYRRTQSVNPKKMTDMIKSYEIKQRPGYVDVDMETFKLEFGGRRMPRKISRKVSAKKSRKVSKKAADLAFGRKKKSAKKSAKKSRKSRKAGKKGKFLGLF